MKPRHLRFGMNLWPPFLGAGIRVQAASGEKVLPQFDVEVRDADDALVARVHKTLYVRLKPLRAR